MKEFSKLIPELNPKRIGKNLARFWKIYVSPPAERSVFVQPETLNIVTKKVDTAPTKEQPKQTVYDKKTGRAFVSCMEGRSLQVFKLENRKIKLETEIEFDDQCVEVLCKNGLLFVTTTNFERSPRPLRNKLWIYDAKSLLPISSINTQGNWSKLIAARPQFDQLLVSNWHSHDISIIDMNDPKKPKVRQILKWGEAPRGIAFTPDGNEAIVTGFYSGNLGILKRDRNGNWAPTYSSPKFDFPNYPGNMRHVLITDNGQLAIVSNLGRNMVHFWDIGNKNFMNSISVGKSPNSMDFLNKQTVIVSCRDSASVYLIDIDKQKVIGRSEITGKEPTGLCTIDSGFLVTCFADNTIEWHQTKL